MNKDDKFYETLKQYHAEGKGCRDIAKILGCHHSTVTYQLKKLNLCSAKQPPLEIIDEYNAKCKRCDKIQSINNFQVGRRGQKYEYRFAYCNECRRNQLNHNLNSSIEKFLKNRYNRTKLRADKLNIPFTISFGYVIELYNKQNGKCFYTNYEMNVQCGEGYTRNALSIDKIIPSLGYINGNIVFCTQYANIVKNDSSLIELKEFITPLYDKLLKYKHLYGFVFEPIC